MEINYATTRGKGASFCMSSGGLAVYPLWKGRVTDALREFETVREKLSRELGVAAVLPDQPLDLDEMDALEAAGLLVVEVPQDMAAAQGDDLAAFVESQVDGVDSMTVTLSPDSKHRALTLSASDASSLVTPPLSEMDENALLQSINDPAADEGSI